MLAVYQLSSSTPDTSSDRAAFAAYTAALARALPSVRQVIVGNEPNLNLFWQPQFGTDGSDVAAPSYEALLATTYDALKALSHPARRDRRRPRAARRRRCDGRAADALADGVHPRPRRGLPRERPEHAADGRVLDPCLRREPAHPAGASRILGRPRSASPTITDLVALLGAAFDGTAQAGSELPIVYGEYGVETSVPADKASLYQGREVVPAVDPATQAAFYRQAIELARRQPTVRMLCFFHVDDESRLVGLQSGVRYVDGTPKPSLDAVRTTSRRAVAFTA